MKKSDYCQLLSVILMSGATMLSADVSQASGCGSYDNTRTISKDVGVRKRQPNEFRILSRTPELVTVREIATGREFALGWMRGEIDGSGYTNTTIEEHDTLFEEGNGCGPMYVCATGRLELVEVNARTGRKDVYSFPMVDEVYTPRDLRYVGKSLLPMFGSMKLDVRSLRKDGDARGSGMNLDQCGYGVW